MTTPDLTRNDFGADKRTGEVWRLDCGQCKKRTNHKVLRSVTHDWETIDIVGRADYTIVRCMGCEQVSYCTRSSNSEDTNPYNGESEINTIQYPEGSIEHNSISLPYATPFEIRNAYNETSKALSLQVNTLGAIGTRLIVELICKAEGGKGRILSDRIESLLSQGVINQDVADTIHCVRFFGNDAVHEYKVKNQELNTAWDTVNMLISYIYGSRDSKEFLMTASREAKLAASRAKKSGT